MKQPKYHSTELPSYLLQGENMLDSICPQLPVMGNIIFCFDEIKFRMCVSDYIDMHKCINIDLLCFLGKNTTDNEVN